MNRVSLSSIAGATFGLALAVTACGTSASVDQTTASYASTHLESCASAHDCAGNQRCVSNRCELERSACLQHEQCGSGRCDAGFCARPSPAMLVDLSKSNVPEPIDYLKAGRDGLVDRRGGLVLDIRPELSVRGDRLRWHDWVLQNWVARGKAETTWVPTLTRADDAPERFVFEHPDTGAQLVAYVRPIDANNQGRTPVSVHAEKLQTALERGLPLGDAVAASPGDGKVVEAVPMERVSLEDGRLGSMDAVVFDGQRALSTGGDRVRVFLARMDFGERTYLVQVGLAAPPAEFADLLDELRDFAEAVRLGGVPADVELGV